MWVWSTEVVAVEHVASLLRNNAEEDLIQDFLLHVLSSHYLTSARDM